MRLPGAVSRAVVAVLAVVLLAGCGGTGWKNLSFRTDDRLHFVTPKDRAKVRQPVRVGWTMRGFRIAAPGSEPPSRNAGYFVVFVDQTPVRPGQTLRAVGSRDPYCKRDPKCPDATYLEQHQIYATTSTSLTLPQIPNLTGSQDKVQRHTVLVVLMDTSGHRIGESAWELDLRIPKVGLS